MIAAARLWLANLSPSARRIGVVIALAIAAIVAWQIWLATHDAKVVQRHEEKREAAAAPAREKSAEERAGDALQNAMADRERELAIAKAEASEAARPPEERATLPPTSIALGCQRLRKAYTPAELAKMAGYQEKCP